MSKSTDLKLINPVGSIQGQNANSLITQELLKDYGEKPPRREFVVKDEVILKRVTKKIKEKVKGMTKGKVGRVVRIIDSETGLVEVDFWDTTPARIPIRSSFLKLVKKAPNTRLLRLKQFFTKPIIRFLNYIIDLLK